MGAIDEVTIEAQVLRMCPHYEILEEIYSEQPNVVPPVIFDSDCENNSAVFNVDHLISFDPYHDDDDHDDVGEAHAPIEPSTPPPSTSDDYCDMGSDQNVSTEPSTSARATGTNAGLRNVRGAKRPRYENNAVVKLAELQESRIEIQKAKIKLEDQKFSHQKEIDERRLDLEKEKLQIEREQQANVILLRKMEIEKELQIFRMKMEYEYRCQNRD